MSIGRATLTKEAVIIDEGAPRNTPKIIAWDNLEVKEYQTYIALFSRSDPAKTHATFSYLNDWNTEVLYALVRRILEETWKQ